LRKARAPKIIEHSERWHEIRHDGVSGQNAYLSPYTSGERREMLNELTNAIKESDAYAIVHHRRFQSGGSS
jgi:hypothetical protein